MRRRSITACYRSICSGRGQSAKSAPCRSARRAAKRAVPSASPWTRTASESAGIGRRRATGLRPKVKEWNMTNVERIRALTPQDLLMLGIKDMAYVKDVEVDGETVVALFAANGQQIAVMEARQSAVAAAWQNGL